jgi:hypothetical protein
MAIMQTHDAVEPLPVKAAHPPERALVRGLSKPAVRWLRLGIEIERIQPGHP